jgi:hypothetical protein
VSLTFAWVDGPFFDAHKVNFDEAVVRSKMAAGREKKPPLARCRCRRKTTATEARQTPSTSAGRPRSASSLRRRGGVIE